MLKKLWRMIFGDPYSFRRIDFPGFTDAEMPKTFSDIDHMSQELRGKRRRNKQIKLQSKLLPKGS